MATAAVMTLPQRSGDELLGSARSRRIAPPSTSSTSATSAGAASTMTVRYSSADPEFESQFPAAAAPNDDDEARSSTWHFLSSSASTEKTGLLVGDHHSDQQDGDRTLEGMERRGGEKGFFGGNQQERATSEAVPIRSPPPPPPPPPPPSGEDEGETHPPASDTDSRSFSVDLPRFPDNGFKRPLRLRMQRIWSAFGSGSRYTPILSGTLYAVMSCTMVLMNKQVLSGYGFKAINSLLLFQNMISVLTVLAGRGLGLFHVEPLTPRLCRIWIPVNALFVAMLLSGFYSLDYLTVPMATILKNLTNVSNAAGDWIFNGTRQSLGVWGAVGLIILSSYCGGATDLHFSLKGYIWQISNCLLASSYSLYLKRTMTTAKSATVSGELSNISMVMLNNTLSLPFGIVLVLVTGETRELASSVALRNPYFWLAATVTGLIGVILNFAVMWFLHATSPTTVGVVSSLSKIPTSVLGLLLFPARTTVYNLSSIAFGLVAGILFTKAKLNQQKQASSGSNNLPR